MFSVSRSKSWEFQELFMMGAPPSMLRSLYPRGVRFLPLFQKRPWRARSLTYVTVFFCEKGMRLVSNVDKILAQMYTYLMAPGPQGNVFI